MGSRSSEYNISAELAAKRREEKSRRLTKKSHCIPFDEWLEAQVGITREEMTKLEESKTVHLIFLYGYNALNDFSSFRNPDHVEQHKTLLRESLGLDQTG